MKPHRALRRCMAASLTMVVFVLVLVVVLWPRSFVGSPGSALATPVRPEDRGGWPLFGGTPQRNLVNLQDRNMPLEWDIASGRNIKWKAKLGSRAYGGVVVARGKVFIGTNNESPRNLRDFDGKRPVDRGILMCFREADGEFLWQAVHDKLPSGLVNDMPKEGIPSMPAVDGNRLYYVNNRCELICADTEGFLDGVNDGVQDEQYKNKTDADIVWRLDMMNELGVFPHNLAVCSPLVVGDLVFAVTGNGVDEAHARPPAPQAPSFVAVHKKTGKVVWTDNAPGRNIMHGQWSNPTYAQVNGAEMVIFPGGDGWLRAFDPPSGKLLWKFDCNPKSAVHKLGGAGTRNDFIATAVVWKDKCYIGVGQDPEHYEGVGHFWCIDLPKAVANGKTNKDNDVSPVGDNFDPKAAANKNSALHWHYGGHVPKAEVMKVGRDFWFGRTMSTCAVHDGLVYAAELAGHLYCFDAQTGVKYWQHDLKSSIWGSLLWVDGKVYLGNEDGDVSIFAHGKEKKLLKKIELNQSIRSTPVAVHGVLYLVTETNLFAIGNK